MACQLKLIWVVEGYFKDSRIFWLKISCEDKLKKKFPEVLKNKNDFNEILKNIFCSNFIDI